MQYVLFFLSFGLLGTCYCIFAIVVRKGWTNVVRQDSPLGTLPSFSLLVVARNEMSNLPALFDCVERLNLPDRSWQFVFVDDHSSDGTLEFAQERACWKSNYSVLSLSSAECGKKAGVKAGILHAEHDIIVQTDADCTFSERWILSILSYFVADAEVVSAPVTYAYGKNLLSEKFFALEFMSLVGSGIGLGASGFPVYCNAANLSYKKHLALSNGEGVCSASGDDVFLLHSAKKKKARIVFAVEKDAIVKTPAPKSVREFLNQRVRWASKAKRYTDIHAVLLSLFIGSYNIALIVACIFGFSNWIFFCFCAALWSIKLVADCMILIPVAHFFEERRLLAYVPILGIIYPFYVAVVSIYSIFAQYEWKGRQFKG